MKLYSILIAAALLATAATLPPISLDGHEFTLTTNAPTTGKPIQGNFHATADLAFKGVRVPKGDYTVTVQTDGPQWHLVINKGAAKVGTVNMVMAKGTPTPTCKISLVKTAALAAKIEVILNDTVASAPFFLDRGANDREW
jgi:hypothetical protein